MVDIPAKRTPHLTKILKDLIQPTTTVNMDYEKFTQFLDSFLEDPISFKDYECPIDAHVDKDFDVDSLIVHGGNAPYIKAEDYNEFLP